MPSYSSTRHLGTVVHRYMDMEHYHNFQQMTVFSEACHAKHLLFFIMVYEEKLPFPSEMREK